MEQPGWTIKGCLDEVENEDIELKDIEICLNEQRTNIRHIKYGGWPDKNVPDNPEDLWPVI